MVHTRINERTANPNPYINFISALPSPGTAYGSSEDLDAKELLRALAAQLKPVMKKYGFTVNSFEEYESNKVFLGRNWNNGETVELVLRDGSGQFYPTPMLLSVFCHELAHIKHMNHSREFHALRCQLCSDVAALQRRGYFGDGYWSAGTRLSDSARTTGQAAGGQEFPEYTCGGAHSQSRASALGSRRRRRPRKPAGPSLSTGAQIVKQRKAGSRVQAKTAFLAAGEGYVLDEGVEKGGRGSGFRKQANSKKAREERALATERRLKLMQGDTSREQTESNPHSEVEDGGEEGEETGSGHITSETDADRLEIMRNSMGGEDIEAFKDEEGDILVVSRPGAGVADNSTKTRTQQKREKDAMNSEQQQNGYLAPNIHGEKHKLEVDLEEPHPKKPRIAGAYSSSQISRYLDSSFILNNASSTLDRVSQQPPDLDEPSSHLHALDHGANLDFPSSSSLQRLSTGTILMQEVRQRKGEALGMGRPRKLGDQVSPSSLEAREVWACHMCTLVNPPSNTNCSICETPKRHGSSSPGSSWSCPACTYENTPDANKCQICDHTKP